MDLNDELIELFAESKLEDAYNAFIKRHGYDPRGHANDHLKYYTYDIEQEGEEEDLFEEPKGPIYVIELTYGEVTRHDCPYSITTSYFLDDVKKEIRELQISKII
jgi:hypothetical protein